MKSKRLKRKVVAILRIWSYKIIEYLKIIWVFLLYWKGKRIFPEEKESTQEWMIVVYFYNEMKIFSLFLKKNNLRYSQTMWCIFMFFLTSLAFNLPIVKHAKFLVLMKLQNVKISILCRTKWESVIVAGQLQFFLAGYITLILGKTNSWGTSEETSLLSFPW